MKSSPMPTDSQKSMSIEEARAVLWLGNDYRYHRPMGELLDEGYLNRSRLEWAAKNAYDPKIKQAAVVLLASMKYAPSASTNEKTPASTVTAVQLPMLEAGITLEQARTTLWPFREFKGQPMGMLVEARQLTLKDLGYAIENARDERVRQAASVLMAMRLNQVVKEPPLPASPLKVLSGGRSYAERRETLLTLIQGMIAGAIVGAYAVMFLYHAYNAMTHPSRSSLLITQPAVLIALALIIPIAGGIAWLISHSMTWGLDRLQDRVEDYRRGQEGEDHTVEAMRQSLDGNWVLFRNVTLPGRNKGDIDAVLVGPPGIWALEIKTFAGEYRNIGEQWEYRAGKRWQLYKPSPSRQARNNAARLSEFLKADRLKQWVEPAVIWANRPTPPLVENPTVAVWTLERLPEELGNLWQDKTILESDRTRIIEKLAKLCQQPEEAD